MPSSCFQRYVALAREGRNELWRLLVGSLLIVAIALMFQAAPFVIPSMVFDSLADDTAFEAVMMSPAGIACLLASFLGFWLGAALAIRWLHRRSPWTVLGGNSRLAWSDFLRGAAAAVCAAALMEAAMLTVDPPLQWNGIGIGEWLLTALPIAGAVLVQSSSEEAAFRGYLLQSLAARFRSPLVWAMFPGALFTLGHWNGYAGAMTNAASLVAIAAFTAAATLLVYRTGNLGAAMGVHFGVNAFGFLIVSPVGGFALFVSGQSDPVDWTIGEAVAFGALGVAMTLVMLWLLLAQRSPLRLTS